MGGSVGLKGTDGVAAEAARLGAVRHSGERAAIALRELLPMKEELTVLCASGEMGGSLVKSLGFPHAECVYETGAETPADDPRRAAHAAADDGSNAFSDGATSMPPLARRPWPSASRRA